MVQRGDQPESGLAMMVAPEGKSHSSLLDHSTHFDNLQMQEKWEKKSWDVEEFIEYIHSMIFIRVRENFAVLH